LAFKINGNRGAQQEICFNKSFKKLYHFNRNFQFKSVIYKMIQLDIRSRTKKSDCDSDSLRLHNPGANTVSAMRAEGNHFLCSCVSNMDKSAIKYYYKSSHNIIPKRESSHVTFNEKALRRFEPVATYESRNPRVVESSPVASF